MCIRDRNNIEVDSIRYEQVKYEFTTYSGMQLVMAWFTPDSSGKVLGKLVQDVYKRQAHRRRP